MDALNKANVMEEVGFGEIVGLIAAARQRAFQAVNTTLINLYWQVGEYIQSQDRSRRVGRTRGAATGSIHCQAQPAKRVLRAPTCSE